MKVLRYLFGATPLFSQLAVGCTTTRRKLIIKIYETMPIYGKQLHKLVQL